MSKLEGPTNPSTVKHSIWTFAVGPTEWGWEHSTVMNKDSNGRWAIPYLERWIVYCGRLSFRVHRFWKKDDDRAPHDHPWWFITIPLRAYQEIVWNGSVRYFNEVWPLRPSFRPATYRHMVTGPEFPVWTFVISGGVSRMWGFWKTPEEFVPYAEWTRDN